MIPVRAHECLTIVAEVEYRVDELMGRQLSDCQYQLMTKPLSCTIQYSKCCLAPNRIMNHRCRLRCQGKTGGSGVASYGNWTWIVASTVTKSRHSSSSFEGKSNGDKRNGRSTDDVNAWQNLRENSPLENLTDFPTKFHPRYSNKDIRNDTNIEAKEGKKEKRTREDQIEQTIACK